MSNNKKAITRNQVYVVKRVFVPNLINIYDYPALITVGRTCDMKYYCLNEYFITTKELADLMDEYIDYATVLHFNVNFSNFFIRVIKRIIKILFEYTYSTADKKKLEDIQKIPCSMLNKLGDFPFIKSNFKLLKKTLGDFLYSIYMVPFRNIPNVLENKDISAKIFSYLSEKDLLNLRSTCKNIKENVDCHDFWDLRSYRLVKPFKDLFKVHFTVIKNDFKFKNYLKLNKSFKDYREFNHQNLVLNFETIEENLEIIKEYSLLNQVIKQISFLLNYETSAYFMGLKKYAVIKSHCDYLGYNYEVRFKNDIIDAKFRKSNKIIINDSSLKNEDAVLTNFIRGLKLNIDDDDRFDLESYLNIIRDMLVKNS